MWNVIVLIPIHCLSIYFVQGEKSNLDAVSARASVHIMTKINRIYHRSPMQNPNRGYTDNAENSVLPSFRHYPFTVGRVGISRYALETDV